VTHMEVLSRTGQRRLQDIVAERRLWMDGSLGRPYHQDALHLHDQPITPCHGPLVVVADDEVVQRRRGGPHLRRTWWTEESIGTASGLWLQTGADSELLLSIVLSRTGGSKCEVSAKCNYSGGLHVTAASWQFAYLSATCVHARNFHTLHCRTEGLTPSYIYHS